MYAREIAHLVIFLYIYLTNSLSLFLYEKIYRIREFVTNLNRYFFISIDCYSYQLYLYNGI